MLETKLTVTIEGTDVTSDISSSLLSFGYEDAETDEADTLRFTLMDPDGIWAGTWRPEGGETVTASIALFRNGIESGTLDCGSFRVDSLRCSGRPRVMEIGAVSVPLDTPIRRLKRVRGFEGVTLRGLASDIAASASLALTWEAEGEGAQYRRVEQSDETDLQFLSRLCKDAGLSVKVTGEQLVVFDQESYESKEAALTVTETGGTVLSWSFSTEKGQAYKKCTVSWRDPAQKKDGSAASYEEAGTDPVSDGTNNPAVMTYTYEDPDIEEGQEYKMRRRCESRAEAEKAAKAKLRELNSRQVTGSLTVTGNPGVVAGIVIAVAGFGAWDGNFIVEKASHSVGSGGYTTAMDLRRVNTKY